MKNYHVWGRAIIGFGVGTVIGNIITLIISYAHGGERLMFMPQLADWFSSEVNAFFVQFLLCGLIGVMFAEAGIWFLVERLNFPVKCLLHFATTALFYLPFLWLCYFQNDPWILFGAVLGNVLFTYVITWMTSYFLIRADVDSINRRIEQIKKEERDGSHSH